MQNSEFRSVSNISSDNQWLKDTFLFDQLIALKDAQTAAARREIFNKIANVLNNHAHKKQLLEKYSDLFLNDPSLQILLASTEALDDASIKAAADELITKLQDEEGQLGTKEKIAAKRQELFEYQAFYESQKELYPYFLTANGAETEYSKFEERMGYLSTHYSSSRELEKDDIEFLFFSTCAWLCGGKKSLEKLRNEIEFLGAELNYDSKKLSEEQKLFILKKLQANKPLMITLTNGHHHVSVQILEVDDIYEVHIFDGMHPRDKSYAIDWAKDLHDFLKKQSGKNVKDEIVDEHLFVQSGVNCGLTSAIGGAHVITNHLTKGKTATKDTFDCLNTLSKFVSDNIWNKIPFILKEQIFTEGQALIEVKFNLNTNAFLFFAETQARMYLLRMLHTIRNSTLDINGSIPALKHFQKAPSYSALELFFYCLFSDNFFRNELREHANFAHAYKTAVDTKQSVGADDDVDDKAETPKSTATTETSEEFLNNIYSRDLIRFMNNISTPRENNFSNFSNSVSQIALIFLCIAASIVVLKNDISFSSLSNSFSR